ALRPVETGDLLKQIHVQVSPHDPERPVRPERGNQVLTAAAPAIARNAVQRRPLAAVVRLDAKVVRRTPGDDQLVFLRAEQPRKLEALVRAFLLKVLPDGLPDRFLKLRPVPATE